MAAIENWNDKDYKAQPPANTIKTIRDIMFKNDIFVLESAWFNHNTMNPFNSVAIAMPGTKLTAAGKGRDEQYALASGYAEWMERLQSLLMIRANFFVGNQEIKTVSFPDGKPFVFGQYVQDNEDILKSFFNSTDIEELNFLSRYDNKMSLFPFYEVMSNSVQYLPMDLLMNFCGSNGLCAGNTPAEAIIQGMCEIFERYVLKVIFTDDEISLPTIPHDLLKETALWKYIETLDAMGMIVMIKDCSLGGKFPVAGVVIQKDDKALFNLGSSPDYRVAIERCFTEMFQGWDAQCIESKMVPIFKNGDEISEKWLENEIQEKLYQYYNQIRKGDGRIPLTLLDESKEFQKKHLFCSSDCFDTNTLIRLIKKVKLVCSKIFIRDVSFLGFPTYQIYIPGITEMKSVSSQMSIDRLLLNIDGIPKARNCFFNINNSNSNEIQGFIDTMEEMLREPFVEYGNIIQTIHNLLLKGNAELNNLDPENLLVLLYCKTEQFHEAATVMNRYLRRKLTTDQLLYPPDFALEHVCLLRVIEALEEGQTIVEIHENLSSKFPRQIITDTCESLFDIDVKEYLGIPYCSDCDICASRDVCACEDIVTFSRVIQDKVNAYSFDQNLQADIPYYISGD